MGENKSKRKEGKCHIIIIIKINYGKSNIKLMINIYTNYTSLLQIKSNQKVLFKVGTFYNNQHKLSRAFQTDMHSKLHKFNAAQL